MEDHANAHATSTDGTHARRSTCDTWSVWSRVHVTRRQVLVSAPVDSLLMASTNDLKNGMVLDLDNGLWSVIEFQHVKPGKGGAFVRTTLKNVVSGKVVDKTFNAGTKVDVATVDKRDMSYLYKEGTDYVFMDSDKIGRASCRERV